MTNQLKLREEYTRARTATLRDRLKNTEELCAACACVYVTGSFGRLEASTHSDLDLFIVGKDDDDEPLLKDLEATCVKADLIRTTRDLGFPDFSGDGEYLKNYSIKQIIDTLGKPDDDSSNTFTARLLLLLESRPLLESQVHADLVRKVVSAYWRDYEGRECEFVPAYLTNDILRLWRTFCVNYEAARIDTDPPEKKAKRKLKNYKLKHSRLLTCYSSLMMLLAIFRLERTVTPEAAFEVTKLTPSGRVKSLVDGPYRVDGVDDLVLALFTKYDRFLETTDDSEANLIARFLDKKDASNLMREASEFGGIVFKILSTIGQENRFHRLLVV